MNKTIQSNLKNLTISLTLSLCVSTNLAAQSEQQEAAQVIEPSVVEPTPLPLDEIQTFAEIFTQIKNNYIEPVSDEQLLDYAIEGMLNGLDPHSVYLKDDRFDDLSEGTSGSFTGLGMEIVMENGFVKVIAPIDDTPAAKAGIQTGDIIIRMDGKTVSGLSLAEATERMRGAPGTSIILTILRESEPDPFDVELTRAVVQLSSVKRRSFGDQIGYLRISQFQTATAESFRKELNVLLENENFRGLILDLRNNPGGLLSSAISISDIFIDDGLIVSTESRQQQDGLKYSATPTDLLEGKPIVVLINGGSASAAEIVAGALQDHGRALILGTNSFGKGSVQTVLNLGEKEAIKLTTARYYTPDGHSIQAQGIVPDVTIEPRQFAEQEEGFARLKENDLPGRLDNDEQDVVEKSELSAEASSLLERDYQLNEAFNLLHGLVLFSRVE